MREEHGRDAGRPDLDRGTTLDELSWPGDVPEFNRAASVLEQGTFCGIIEAVWQGIASFRAEVLAKVDFTAVDANVENGITQRLAPLMQRALSPFNAVFCQAQWDEEATRARADRSPPVYDIAFVLRINHRAVWPIEAKVVDRPGAVANYVGDIRNEYLTCRYAPFSNSGGMLAYLRTGDPARCLAAISDSLGARLKPYRLNPARAHRISRHKRKRSHGIRSPRIIRIHHFVLDLS